MLPISKHFHLIILTGLPYEAPFRNPSFKQRVRRLRNSIVERSFSAAAVAEADPDAHALGDTDTDTHPDGDRDPDTHALAVFYGVTYSVDDPNTHANSYSDTYSGALTRTKPVSDFGANAAGHFGANAASDSNGDGDAYRDGNTAAEPLLSAME